jgi:hypothetical protein
MFDLTVGDGRRLPLRSGEEVRLLARHANCQSCSLEQDPIANHKKQLKVELYLRARGDFLAYLVRNEHIKLFASWCNSISAALITVGILTPIAVRLYGSDVTDPNRWTGSDLFLICFVIAIYIHAIG